MPTPIGHSLAGLAVAWSFAGHRAGRSAVRLALACVLLSVAPDADLLFAVHRAAWHSLTAALVVGIMAWLWMTSRGQADATRVAVACALAWASHVGLDWLGRDQSPPQGVMALWPVSHAYFESGLGMFAEVSRRYWKPDEFVWGNLRSLARELAILLPAVALAWLWRKSHSRCDFLSLRPESHTGSDFLARSRARGDKSDRV